jgi:hypothetical protein
MGEVKLDPVEGRGSLELTPVPGQGGGALVASVAGVLAVVELRQRGFDGELIVVGNEQQRPYDRPPFSKDVLAGRRTAEATILRPTSLYDELELGRAAVGLDPERRRVSLSGGRQLSYDGLVFATGTSPVQIRDRALEDAQLCAQSPIVWLSSRRRRPRSAWSVSVQASSAPRSLRLPSATARTSRFSRHCPAQCLECSERRSAPSAPRSTSAMASTCAAASVLPVSSANRGSPVFNFTMELCWRPTWPLSASTYHHAPPGLKTQGLAVDNSVVCDAFCRASAPLYGRGGQLAAALGFNRSRPVRILRNLVTSGSTLAERSTCSRSAGQPPAAAAAIPTEEVTS